MTKQEFNQLAEEYGTDKAKKAMTWLYDNTTADFRKCVYIVGFLESNELLWNQETKWNDLTQVIT